MNSAKAIILGGIAVVGFSLFAIHAQPNETEVVRVPEIHTKVITKEPPAPPHAVMPQACLDMVASQEAQSSIVGEMQKQTATVSDAADRMQTASFRGDVEEMTKQRQIMLDANQAMKRLVYDQIGVESTLKSHKETCDKALNSQ